MILTFNRSILHVHSVNQIKSDNLYFVVEKKYKFQKKIEHGIILAVSVFNRANRFHVADIQTHVNDLVEVYKDLFFHFFV